MANTARNPIISKKLQREEDKFNATFKKKTTKTDEEEKAPLSEKSSASFLKTIGTLPKNAPQNAILLNPQTEATAAHAILDIPQIKDSIGRALEEKFGVLDARSSIAKIEDSEVEKSIPIAEETIARNVKSGKTNKYTVEKYPYMLDAFAMMYAAGNAGDKKLANNLYKLAYTEGEVGINSKSYTPKTDFSSLADSAKVSADPDLALEKNELTNSHKQIRKVRYDIDAEDDSGSKVYASTPDAEITLYSNKLKEGKGPVIQNDEPETGLPAIGSLSNGYPHTISKILENSIKNFKKINGESYCDLTANGEGLDAELDPTPLEAARMVKYLSAVTKINGDKSGIDIGDWKWSGIYKSNLEGLDMGVFVKKVNGKITYAIVNCGSNTKILDSWNAKETKHDWTNNFEQLSGDSQDMKDSIAFSLKFVEEHPDANIIFVGHSKGGAEAAANAVATGKKAILFNPAKANFEAIGLNIEDYDEEILSYVVDGEFLDELTRFLPFKNPAKKIVIGKESVLEEIFNKTPLGAIVEFFDGFFDHSIESIIKNLDTQGEIKK